LLGEEAGRRKGLANPQKRKRGEDKVGTRRRRKEELGEIGVRFTAVRRKTLNILSGGGRGKLSHARRKKVAPSTADKLKKKREEMQICLEWEG